MALSSFISATSGITAQSQALSTVSSNIANISTTGYKETNTMFYTLLSGSASASNTYSSVDVTTQGVGTYDRTLVSVEGALSYTGGTYDVAISGNSNAFFVVNDSNGNSYYTRAGDFSIGVNGDTTYLSTSSGYAVQGYEYLGDGVYSTTLSDIVIDPDAMVSSTPTTSITISGNVPASDVETSSYGLTVYGENNDGETVAMIFTKVEDAVNTWEVSFSTSDGTITSTGQTVYFGTDGLDPTPSTLDLDISWDDSAGGGTSSVTIDISNMTQLSASSSVTSIVQNGSASGTLESTYIDDDGILRATYSNGQTVPISQIGLVGFASPDSLQAINETMFSANSASGEMYELSDYGDYLYSGYLEGSTVDIESAFADLILVQQAYSLNTQSFTVLDEMLQEAVNLKA